MAQTDARDESARSLLDKLRDFITTLDDDERALMAALLGPGVARAYLDDPDDVTGFAVTWDPGRLPAHLATEIRRRELRIEGF